MEKIKTLKDYTQEEIAEMDGGTIADILWDEKRNIDYVKPLSLKESILEYESNNRLNYWN